MKADSPDELAKLAEKVIATRIGDFAPLVLKWKQEHARVPLARLVEDGLRLALKRYAGKREAHLVADVVPTTEMAALRYEHTVDLQTARNLKQHNNANKVAAAKGKVAA